METKPYYLTRLSPAQKSVYKLIAKGLVSHASEIQVLDIPSGEISRLYRYLLLDNPMIFYTNAYALAGCALRPVYAYPQDAARGYAGEVLEYLRVFEQIAGASDLEKELFVHDYCLDNFSYGFGEFSHSVLGAVLKRTAVCEGIAKFVKLALDYLEVKCIVVTGKATNPATGTTENHAWNIVKIGGKPFHLDVTFDLCLSDKMKRYDYFNLSDEDINRDHVVMEDVPACLDAGCDFYSINKQVVNSSREMKNFIATKLGQGDHSFVFKIANANAAGNIAERVIKTAKHQYEETINKAATLNYRYNPKQMVFEINFT